MPRTRRYRTRDERMRDRRMRDRASRRNRRRDMGYYGSNGDREHYGRYDTTMYSEYDYAGRGRSSQSGGQSDRHYDYPMMGGYEDYNYDYARGRSGSGRGRDRNYDYGYDYRGRRDYGESEYLSDEDLMDWSRDLLESIEQKDRQMYTRESISQRARDMGVEFRDFSEDELVVTTLMMVTDYGKTLGTTNLDMMIKLAKDWLCDEDSELQYGEKLAAYYEYVVDPED